MIEKRDLDFKAIGYIYNWYSGSLLGWTSSSEENVRAQAIFPMSGVH
jgi:hypothetical protein